MAKKVEIDDRFKKFGVISFTATTKVNDFIDYLEQGKVMGTKCKKCGKYFFPPRADCCSCLSSDMEWFEITNKGKLVSYSRLQYGPTGFEKELPYIIALLDFGDYKVFGWIDKEIPEEELKVGMDMGVKVNKMDNGQIIYVFTK